MTDESLIEKLKRFKRAALAPDDFYKGIDAAIAIVRQHEAAKAELPSSGQPDELTKVIRRAVEEGNAEYWRPSNEHDAALREWKLGGFKGVEPARKQTNHGSVIDCISGSLKKILSPYLSAPKRESSGVHGYEISGNTIYIGPMRPDRVKVADITCTIDWNETYTDEAKQRRIRDAERICRGLDRE